MLANDAFVDKLPQQLKQFDVIFPCQEKYVNLSYIQLDDYDYIGNAEELLEIITPPRLYEAWGKNTVLETRI
jgi:hypothetical protein